MFTLKTRLPINHGNVGITNHQAMRVKVKLCEISISLKVAQTRTYVWYDMRVCVAAVFQDPTGGVRLVALFQSPTDGARRECATSWALE